MNIAIFASGEGTNAESIINHFKSTDVKITLVCNKSNAGVLTKAKLTNIPTYIIDKDFNLNESYDLIILAGFLWKIPNHLIKQYPNKIINIHPSLLPKFGGKGMYGMNVHKAVIDAKEVESGITIHYINENYDEGDIIKQYKCHVYSDDTTESLSNKVRVLELENYAKVIEELINA
jgi:phosphoribosylglycinamide formyltransferase-1